MEMEFNYLASKKWEKVGRQELCSTPYEQEIDPRLVMKEKIENQIDLKFA
jgi:hypothetical protein